MPKRPDAVRPGSYLRADMLDEVMRRMVQVITGGYDINVYQSGNRIVVERASYPIIPIGGGGAAEFGDDITDVGEVSLPGTSDTVPRSDHVHGMNKGSILYGGGIRLYTAANETARDALLSYGYPTPSSVLYARNGDFCYQTDNQHMFQCRDTGSAFQWEGISHWEVSST